MNRDIFIKRKKKAPIVPVLVLCAVVAGLIAAGYYAVGYFRETAVAVQQAGAASSMDEARALLEKGDPAGARAIAAPLAATGADSDALAFMAQVEREAGDLAQAEAYLRQFADGFPNHPDRPKALVQLGAILEGLGRDDDARGIYVGVKETAPPALRAPALAGLARLAHKQGNLEEAQALSRQAVDDAPWDSPEWNEAAEVLGQVNVALIFSTKQTADSEYYTVTAGDNLTDIGKKLNTTQGLLTRANGLSDDATLRVGDRLKYTHKDFRIVIERETRRLFLYDGGGLFKVYKAGLGREGKETALGAYRIGNKQKDPDWFKPGEGRIPYGDPRNELGTRWMPLVPEEADLPRDLGIHGTWADESIGEFSSSGCARMSNADVEELFDLVVRATPVDIVDRQQPTGA